MANVNLEPPLGSGGGRVQLCQHLEILLLLAPEKLREQSLFL